MSYQDKEKQRENKRKYYLKNRKFKIIKQRKWRKNNPQRLKEYNRKYYIDNKEKLNYQGKKWRRENSQKVKDYYIKNSKKKREYTINWRKNNPAKASELRRRMRALKEGYTETFSEMEWQLKIAKTNGFCQSCFSNVGIKKLTIHHYPPVSKIKRGHKYSINDVFPICQKCNSTIKNKKLKKVRVS